MNVQTPGSDPVYKRLYAFPEMVADLLRSLFPDDALGADYDSLRRLPAEYVADDYRQRRGDAVWRSAAQVRELVARTGAALSPYQPSQRHVVLDERRAAADDPQVRELTRAVLLLEQSRSAADLARAAESLSRVLSAPAAAN